MARTVGFLLSIGARMASSVGTVFDTVAGRAKKLKSELRDLKARSSAASRLQSTRDRMRDLRTRSRAGEDVSKELADTIRAFKRAQRAAKDYGLSIRDVGRAQGDLASRIKRTEAALNRQATLQRNKDKRRELHGEVMGTLASVGAMVIPVKIAIDFEDSMARVKALSNATEEEFAQLTAKARQLGRDTRYTASQAAEGMQYLAMAGFKTNQILDAMPGMLNLAAAGATDLGRSSDIASDILSAFQIKAEEMPRVADILCKAFTSSNTTLETLSDSMKYVAPVASAAGISIEQCAAMVGLLGNVGIKGSRAGTALRAAMLRLVAPPKMAADALKSLTGIDDGDELAAQVEDLKHTQKVLEDMGIKTKDAAGNMRPIVDILEDFNERTKDMGNADRLEKVKHVFGVEASAAMEALLVQAGKTVDENGQAIVDAYGNQTTALRKYIGELENSEGTATRIAETMENTTGGGLRKLKSAVEDTAISFGNLLLPGILATAGALTVVSNGVSGLVTEFPVASKVVALAAASLVVSRSPPWSVVTVCPCCPRPGRSSRALGLPERFYAAGPLTPCSGNGGWVWLARSAVKWSRPACTCLAGPGL